MNDKVLIMIAMTAYMLVIIGIGLFYAKRSNESSENYFLGGRSLGPYVTAMSAEASDMSGWLLMGLPGVAYWTGVAGAFWTALGIGVGTYVNWLIVAKRLRVYSKVANDSITMPDYLSNRFLEKRPVIMVTAAVFILIFFTVYAASCFVTMGKLFSTLFGLHYHTTMILGAAFVVIYTFLGGFLAESVSDFLQSIVMVIALACTIGFAVHASGGLGNVFDNIRNFPGFLEFFGIADPVMKDGAQAVVNGVPQFADRAAPYGVLTILSTVGWGLGYFGVPQVLLRFMGIRDAKEIKVSRRTAVIWVFISLAAAVLIGLAGRAMFPTELLTSSASESIFIKLAEHLMPPVVAGIMMAGILAATISSSDSYLLIASSAVAKNLYQRVFHRGATDRQVMRMSRITLIVITVVAIFFAMDEESVIFNIVSFAWAGFGATFGPIMVFSLFWKRVSEAAAVSGMFAGGIMVFVWGLVLKPMGGVFAIYELLPAFVVSSAVIIIVSLITVPKKAVTDMYEVYREELKKVS